MLYLLSEACRKVRIVPRTWRRRAREGREPFRAFRLPGDRRLFVEAAEVEGYLRKKLSVGPLGEVDAWKAELEREVGPCRT